MYRLKELRREKGLSQKELAERLGCGQNTISLWESGKRLMDSATLLKVADFYGVTADYLLGKDFSAMNFGDRLKYLRKSKGINQEDLANILGLTRSAVSKWEAAENTPPADVLVRIADYFDISLDCLCGRPGAVGSNVEKATVIDAQSMRLLSYYDKLNDIGKREAIIRILELCLNHDYLKNDE